MNSASNAGPPSPDEVQRHLSDFIRQHLQGAQKQTTEADTQTSSGDPTPAKGPGDQFEFNYKPRDIKAYLDRFVIKQDDAKKVLSVALCDHYHHVRMAFEGKQFPDYAKQNIILVG